MKQSEDKKVLDLVGCEHIYGWWFDWDDIEFLHADDLLCMDGAEKAQVHFFRYCPNCGKKLGT